MPLALNLAATVASVVALIPWVSAFHEEATNPRTPQSHTLVMMGLVVLGEALVLAGIWL